MLAACASRSGIFTVKIQVRASHYRHVYYILNGEIKIRSTVEYTGGYCIIECLPTAEQEFKIIGWLNRVLPLQYKVVG